MVVLVVVVLEKQEDLVDLEIYHQPHHLKAITAEMAAQDQVLEEAAVVALVFQDQIIADLMAVLVETAHQVPFLGHQ
jgi:hypothetical protein